MNYPHSNSDDNKDRIPAAEILPMVYNELRKLAMAKIKSENPGQTLSATALVHEAFLRITKNGDQANWDTKGHFFAAASEAMRRILVETAIRKKRIKRGGDRKKIDFDAMTGNFEINDEGWSEEMIDLDEALSALEKDRKDAAQLVSLRYFAGMKMKDAARVMNISERTAHRHWNYAKAWLFQYLNR